jgi:hypothetical protein
MFNLLDQLFNPGRRHTDEEEHRLELTREETGNGDPGRGPIDLDSGAVTIRPPRGAAESGTGIATEPAPARHPAGAPAFGPAALPAIPAVAPSAAPATRPATAGPTSAPTTAGQTAAGEAGEAQSA